MLFNPGHQSSPMDRAAFEKGGIGGTIDGTFQEYIVFEESGLVRLASNLSYIEGASLSNAAGTVWNALYGGKPIKHGDWVLIQGAGRVSLFAIQFAKDGGARVVATTSSPADIKLLKPLGIDHTINCREDPSWGATARKLTTNEEGFDQIVEVGGTDTMASSLNAIKFEGTSTVIGLVTGFPGAGDIMEALKHICTLRGIHVGSRVQIEEMMAGMEANKIQPSVDKSVFPLHQLREALEYLVRRTNPSTPWLRARQCSPQQAQKHIGKMAIQVA